VCLCGECKQCWSLLNKMCLGAGGKYRAMDHGISVLTVASSFPF
jgi:hypothetical protein